MTRGGHGGRDGCSSVAPVNKVHGRDEIAQLWQEMEAMKLEMRELRARDQCRIPSPLQSNHSVAGETTDNDAEFDVESMSESRWSMVSDSFVDWDSPRYMMTIPKVFVPMMMYVKSKKGERNFNRFGGWLGKNSTMGKNLRLLEDVHYHILASCASNLGRDTLRVDYLTALLKRLTEPLRQLPKDEAVQKSIEFMNLYSIGLEDFDTIMELLKFKGHPNPMEGIETSVKTALTKAYKKSTSRIRAADLISLPGIKKAPKKRIAAMLEPADDSLKEENPDTLADSEEEDSSDTEDLGGAANGDKKLQDLQGLNSKGIQVQLNLKGTGNSSAKKTPAGRGKGGSGAAEKKGGQGRGSGVAAKRKR